MSERRIDLPGTSQFSALSPRPAFFMAALTSVALSAALCASGKYREAAAASVAVLSIAFILTARVSIEVILITWFVTTPLAYFYIRFPVDKSIITYDRAAFALVVLMLWLSRRGQASLGGKRNQLFSRQSSAGREQAKNETESLASLPPAARAAEAPRAGRAPALSVSRFEIAWALLCTLALASAAMEANDAAYATKIAVDSFFLPLAAFHIARHHFDARGRASLLLLGATMLALFLFTTGAFEFATGTNLFQYKGSQLIRERELRVNGPFAADTSYTIICLLIAVFLQAAPGMLRARPDAVARLLYVLAVGAAIIATLLSLFRATAIALVICWMVLRGAGGRGPGAGKEGAARAGWLSSSRWPMVAIGIVIAVIALGPFSIGRRITDPRNAFGRLATWEAAAGVAIENPLFGVGLTNYRDYFHAKYNWEAESVESVLHTRAADSPHSNLLWIAAELGLAALVLYLMANLYLFFMGLRAMRRAEGARQRAAAACYLALIVAYWIPGATLASGYYSDLNLYFFFMLGLLSNESLVA